MNIPRKQCHNILLPLCFTPVFVFVLFSLLCGSAHAQIINTIVGSGTVGSYSGDGGLSINATLKTPVDVIADASGNLYIADFDNHRIRKVDTSGIITTVAGNGTAGFSGDGGSATSAKLQNPEGLILDATGNLYIADSSNHRVRKVDTSGIITTVAGDGSSGFSGDGGPATNAKLDYPGGLILDATGNLYIADLGNHRIRKVDTSGNISTVAGNGFGFSGDGGPATNAKLRFPTDLSLDTAGNLYIADSLNHRVRKVDTSGIITTVAGNGSSGFSGDEGLATNAKLNRPYGLSLDATGNLYIVDWLNNRIRKVDTFGTITTVAGNGTEGFSGDGGPAINATLFRPRSVDVDIAGDVYIADTGNHRIRKVGTSEIQLQSPNGGEVYLANSVQTIVYAATNVNNVTLEFSTNNGITWNLISGATPAVGVHSWQVPNITPVISLAKIRVTNADELFPTGVVSNGVFTITPVFPYTVLASVDSNGVLGDLGSDEPSLSEDGRYVAFSSNATNFAASDTNAAKDIFVHDFHTGITSRVSVDSNGIESNGNSGDPHFSADGRFVTYWSSASNLVPGDTNGRSDIFLHDLQTGNTSRVSLASATEETDNGSDFSVISADGRFIAYESKASNIAAGDTNGDNDIFVYDTQTQTTTLVSANTGGVPGNNRSRSPSITGDGRYVTFWSDATDLIPGGTNGNSHIFMRDLQTGTTTIISKDSNGVHGNANSFSRSISANGRYVAFHSFADNLVSGDINGQPDVFLHDTQTGITSIVSVDSNGVQGNGFSRRPVISKFGRFVAFESTASNLVSGDTNSQSDIFVHDTQTGRTKRFSVSNDGIEGNNGSEAAYISADGSAVTFWSDATNLVSNDTNGRRDIFVRQLDFDITSEFTLLPPSEGINCDSVREYTVRISDATNVVGYRVAINFDPSKASYVPFSADVLGTDAAADFNSLTVNDLTPGQVIFTNASEDQALNAGPATILKFSLDFNNTLEEGEEFTISFLPISNLNDGAIPSDFAALTETVNPVNDRPTFTIPNPFVQRLEDEGPQSIISFATNISAGDPNEASQQLTFSVEVDDESLFAATPTISATGTLSFTSAANANGITSATVYLIDDGGVANCGIDTSTAAFFTIEVLPVNDAPAFALGLDQFINEDDPAQTVIGFATNISVGPVNEATQSYQFLTSTNNNALFSATPVIDTTGTLTYTPAPNANGSALVTVIMQDNGGTANGGVDSSTQTFNITVFAVNDEPTIDPVPNQFILEDSGLNLVNLSGISDGDPELDQPLSESLIYTNPGLIASASIIVPASSATGTIQITPALNEFGTSIFTLTLQDNGSNVFPNDNTVSSSFVVNVSPVNDAPSFIVGASQNILNVTGGTRTVVNWASGIIPGPTNENNQLLNFSVETDQPSLFAVAPAVTSDGTLSFTPAAGAHGIANVSLSIHDDGGTLYGGVNASATESFTITKYTQFLWGDLNVDNVSGTVDASLILRFDAALLPTVNAFGETFQEFPGYPIVEYPEYFKPRAGTLPFPPLLATFPLAFPPAANVAGNDNEAGVLDAAQLLRVAALLDDFVQSDTSFDGIGPDAPIFLTKQVSRSQVIPRSLLVDLSAERSDTVSNAFTAWNMEFFVDNGEDLSGFRIALEYDPAVVEVDPFGVEALSGAVIVVNDTQPGRLIVSGALINIPGAGPAKLISVRMVSASNSDILIDSIRVDVDEALTRLNDGALQLSAQSVGEVLLSETTDVSEWMILE